MVRGQHLLTWSRYQATFGKPSEESALLRQELIYMDIASSKKRQMHTSKPEENGRT